MTKKKCSAIIISISSDIGIAMARRWQDRGWDIFGTYRMPSPEVSQLRKLGIGLTHCDLLDVYSVEEACRSLQRLCPTWDILIMCPGTLDPVSSFIDCCFDEWKSSLTVNFTSQMRILRRMLPSKHSDSGFGSCVLFFAGGGVNSAPINYSAYTVSKIALIKMCELLDAEIPNTRFVIVGPGWVDTKIHKTRPANISFTPMDRVLDCCDWLIDSPRRAVSGRNFSVAFDSWGTRELAEMLIEYPDMYKLRRCGNDRYE